MSEFGINSHIRNECMSEFGINSHIRNECMSDNKKIGFVVDLNISRVLNTCINYTVYKNEKSIDDKIKYLIKYFIYHQYFFHFYKLCNLHKYLILY